MFLMSGKEDFRKLSIDAQASMRKIALKLVSRGDKQGLVADLIGVSRQTISQWETEQPSIYTRVVQFSC